MPYEEEESVEDPVTVAAAESVLVDVAAFAGYADNAYLSVAVAVVAVAGVKALYASALVPGVFSGPQVAAVAGVAEAGAAAPSASRVLALAAACELPEQASQPQSPAGSFP